MTINAGQLLVDFIGLQATPITIGNAVQGAVQSGTYGAAELGAAALNGVSSISSFGATLADISSPLATKALGGLAGAAALAGLTNDYANMQKDLNSNLTGGNVSDSTLLSAMSNVSALLAAALTGAAAAGFAVPLATIGLATAAAVGLGYYALSQPNGSHDIADLALNLLSQAQDLCDTVGVAMMEFANSMADGFIDFGFGLGDWLNDLGEEITNTVNDLFTAAQKFRLVFDPLTLDLDGDGLETTGIAPNAPILFDHNADGIKTGTGWVKADDGMLVLDRNGNGSIDSGLELFGDSTVKSNGQLALDGFDALADLDSNADGQISSADAQFAGLRVWRDLNQDGISQGGELFTLDSLGIASIGTTKTANSQTLANGNQIADLGTYTRTDGSAGTSGDMSGRVAAQQRGTHRPTPCGCNLAADTFHREFTSTLDTTAVAALPDMQGSPERSRRGSGVRGLMKAANDVVWRVAA